MPNFRSACGRRTSLCSRRPADGGGTHNRLTLVRPLRRPAAAAQAAGAASPAGGRPSAQGGRVLRRPRGPRSPEARAAPRPRRPRCGAGRGDLALPTCRGSARLGPPARVPGHREPGGWEGGGGVQVPALLPGWPASPCPGGRTPGARALGMGPGVGPESDSAYSGCHSVRKWDTAR